MQGPPTSLVLFHCRFADHGMSDHRTYSFDRATYAALPHLYALCAIDDACRPERMTAGLLVKTNVRYEDPAFLDTMAAAFQAVPVLTEGRHEHISLVPSPVDAGSPHPLTQEQVLMVFQLLWSEHLAAQVTARFTGRGVRA